MLYTSASLNKKVKALNEEKETILARERNNFFYERNVGEVMEHQDYDFTLTQKYIEKIDEEVRNLKHALNLFNTRTFIESPEITLDQAIILLAQLNARKNKMAGFKDRNKITRVKSFNSPVITEQVLNFEPEEALKEYERLSEEISSLQLQIDRVNITVSFNVD